ncbi:sigma-70 family RNA polymerase sigma factor [Nodosilinea sp. LEGE 07298]|uniref:RNA polymerase sigma factor n=1 Tax=Nodosilinea sp. LEGE 07298 TaxID=2777970 RepID=UPI00187EB61F|nr:sigma-70 family RNA polymerase sigma factor [Nodosilinea sp. LEGE 07298]MBE9108753.1 sigma-70 family RNA polymerase sigma factor [Nodosilinea sp. LEGE 07298]
MSSTAHIPNFPECDHRLVQGLHHLSDRELVQLFQHHGEAGRYFTAIFCRYSPMVYSLIRHSARSPVQAEYLFALTWRHILHELGGVECPEALVGEGPGAFTLQNWLINITALCINQAVVPEVESIHYSLAQATPPFWCYVEQALDRLPAVERLVAVMALTFRWSENRIAAYLQAEGETLTASEVRQKLALAFQHLETALPEDIRQIYLGDSSLRPEPLPDDLNNLLDVPDLEGAGLDEINLVGAGGELGNEWAN